MMGSDGHIFDEYVHTDYVGDDHCIFNPNVGDFNIYVWNGFCQPGKHFDFWTQKILDVNVLTNFFQKFSFFCKKQGWI